jgi:beta-glucosidase
MAVLDEKCRRILGTAIQFGWLDREQTISSIPLNNPNADKVTLEESLESITLLKNEGGLLPLNPTRVKTLAVIGPEATLAVVGGGGSSQTTLFHADSHAGSRRSLQGDVCSRPSTPRNHLWPHLVPQSYCWCKWQGRAAHVRKIQIAV